MPISPLFQTGPFNLSFPHQKKSAIKMSILGEKVAQQAVRKNTCKKSLYSEKVHAEIHIWKESTYKGAFFKRNSQENICLSTWFTIFLSRRAFSIYDHWPFPFANEAAFKVFLGFCLILPRMIRESIYELMMWRQTSPALFYYQFSVNVMKKNLSSIFLSRGKRFFLEYVVLPFI